jgi:bifunctional non-homologous end joining protein LigD
MRNAYAQTVAASYAVRARPGATVATPLDWSEVEDDGLDPRQFTIKTVLSRAGDPWADYGQTRYGLGQAAERLAKLEK